MKNKVLRKVLAVALSAAMLTGTGFTAAGQFIGTNISVNAGAYIPNSTVWYDPTDITSTSIALSGSGTFPAGAFGGYPYLTNIVISGSVVLPENAFKEKTSLQGVAFNGTTTSIPKMAFYHCTGITYVNYGNVATIGESAFNGCTAYASLSYATKVTSVGKSAFYNCTKLASVSLPNVKTIGASAFSTCTALNKVDLGSNVTTIGDYAFYKCSKLTAITLPKTVTSIGTGAFQGCTNLMISGYAGSTAETYAWNNGKNFNYLDHTNVTSVSLQSLSVEQGKTATITATVSPSNAYKKTLKWSSNNTNVATVNGSGVVTAVGTGTATITAKSHNGQTATCQVTVTAPVLATGISLNKTSTSLQKGQSETLTATVTPSNTSNKAVTWGSNNTSVATVNNGTVTAVGAGTATITATTSNGISAACQVTVSQEVVEVTGISLNKTSASIAKGNSETLTATITPSNATNKAVTWSSSNTSVATVSGGTVTAVGFGTATITATTSNGISVTCQITVPQEVVEVTGISLNKTSVSISKGSSETLTATITPSNATNKAVTWSSNNTSVATVNNGTVTAVGAGTATITATTNNGKTATCTVTVNGSYAFEWGVDNWSFNNFDIPNYSVNYDVMEQMQYDFGMEDYEIEMIQKDIDKRNRKGYEGSCFGMTVSEIMTKQGDLQLSRYGCDDIVNKNKMTDNSVSVINFIQSLQSSSFSQYIRQSAFVTNNQYDFISTIESSLKNDSNKFINLCYGVKKFDNSTQKFSPKGYHSVLAYGIENINIDNEKFKDVKDYVQFTGKNYDRRILLADPNALSGNEIEDLSCLYYNSSDHSWAIPYFNFEDNKNNETSLCFWNSDNIYDTQTGEITDLMKYNSLTEAGNMMSGNAAGHYIAGIKLENISGNEFSVKQVQNSGNPNMDYNGSLGSPIAKYRDYTSDTYGDVQNEFFALWNPTASYEISYEKPSDYYTKMDYEGLVYLVDASDATYTLFKPNGYVGLKGYDASFDISIMTDKEQSVTDWYSVGISGENSNNLIYRKTKDGYILSSDNLENITVTARNKHIYLSKTFSTNYDSVLIYEIDETTIGLKVDTDSNGTYETDITNPLPLENNSVLSSENISLGESITATAQAAGGTGEYLYQVVYKKTSDSKWTTAQGYKANSTVTFKPASATTYDVCVKVKDSSGAEIKKFFTVTVKSAELTNLSTISSNSIQLGNTVAVNSKATGGTSPYKYAVYYKASSSSTWSTKQDFSTNTSVSIKFSGTGTKDICVKVKDSNGTVSKKYFTVKVSAGLTNNSTVSATSITLGNTVTVNAKATGGTSPYKYAVYYKASSSDSWTTKQNFSTNASVSIKFAGKGTKNICVKVKDNTGTISKKYFTVTVK